MSDSISAVADESAHETSVMEWWFIQGHYEGSRSDRRYFMTSFFRQNILLESTRPLNGFSLLLSVLNPTKERAETLTQTDPSVIELFLRLEENHRQANLDGHLVEAYINEIGRFGPPRPIRLEKDEVKMASHPLGITWSDFSLHQHGQDFHLAFIEPESRRGCHFHLLPKHPRMYIEGLGAPHVDSMAYVTYPSLDLTGTVEDEEVCGQAWLDHQWGNYGWFVAQSPQKRLLGWEWFGINLEDGSDWVVLIHRDMQSGRSLARSAVVREEGQPPRLCKKFTAEPIRYWESKITHIRYPVAWRIRIPEIKADLVYEALVDNQEIQSFGVFRAIWEGAGKVSGTLGGSTVMGQARLELHGYGYIFDFQNYLSRLVSRVDRLIEEFLPKMINEAKLQEYAGPAHWENEASAHTQMLSQPIWDLISREGKRWRPIFGILMLESLGIPSERYEMLAAVIPELCHTGSLIIDDIEDDSHLRRGDESIHLRYGLDVAINAGNSLYFLPYLLLSNHPHLDEQQRIELYRIMVKQSVRAHLGQGLDIYWTKNLTIRNLTRWMRNALGPKILQMYAYKTAAAVEGMAENACAIAKSDPATREACISFARVFGVAFQIMDDIHNFDDSSHRKRICGEDLSSGKLTYVIFRALQNLKSEDRSRLQRILCSKTLRKNPSALEEGVDLVRSSGALRSSFDEAQGMVEREWSRFSQQIASSDPKTMLRMLCSNLLDLPYRS